MIKRKKLITLLIVLITVFTGCFTEKKNDESKGVNVLRSGNSITVLSNEDSIAGSYIIDKEISESDIFVEADKLKIVKNESGKSYIDIVDLDENIKKGDILFKIENCTEFIKITEKENINVKDFQNETTKNSRVEIIEELLGDFNNNGEVEILDLVIFKENYNGTNMECDIAPAQLGTSEKYSKIYSKRFRDNKINLTDFIIFGKNYGMSVKKDIVTGIEIETSNKEGIIEVGSEMQLKSYIKYSNGDFKEEEVNATSSDTNVLQITVSKNIINLKGLKAGTAVVKVEKGGIVVSKTVTVVNIEKGITIYVSESYGNQIYAWDSESKPLLGAWPGKKLTEKEGNFYALTFDTAIKTVNYLILKDGNKVTTDKATTTTLWITEDGIEHKENPLKGKPIIKIEPNGNVTGETVITIKISSFEENSAIAVFGSKTVQISKTGGSFKVSDYLDDKATGILKVSAGNSIGESSIEVTLTRDDTQEQTGHPVIPKDKINNTCYQAFYWESNGGLWTRLKSKVSEFAEIGVTSMWLPPANKCGSGAADVGYGAYDFWDLGEFDQKGSVGTKWGTKGELESLISEMHNNGIDAYYDVVFNHKIGSDGQETFNGRTAWTKYNGQGRYKYYSKANNWSWNHDCFDGDNKGLFPGKSWDVAEDYLMGEDIDYENGNVIDEMKEWGKWVITDVKFDGFRMDAIKHIRNEFVKDWVNYVKGVTGKSNMFFVGEAWIEDVGSLKNYLNAVGNSIKVFDFPLRNDFVAMSGGGKDLRNWGGLVNSDKSENAVTFLDNHDTCRNGNPYNKPQITKFKNQGYAYILINAKGTPCVYGKDYEDYGMKASLDKMITARRYYAYGEAVEQSTNDADVYSYVRKGISEAPKSGCVLMISDGQSGNSVTKKITGCKPNKEYYDITGNITETVKTDSNGSGDFKVIQSEAKGWSIWVQK